MRLTLLENSYLYEGLDRRTAQSMILWESAGRKITEAALTADQIKQIFSQIEKDSVTAGGSRTVIGKGVDAAKAIDNAWEDLKTKIQNSGPIKGFDQKVSDALSKIGVGAKDPEFNGKVNKWVQKYRDFAEKHPIAQGAIYATLIALAGISGAGVGGAAALGLLKMADKLLQGERFSSAAYAGAKTGITAFAASKLGDLIKGVQPGEQIPVDPKDSEAWQAVKRDFENYDYYMHPDNGSVVAVPKGMGSPFDPSTPAGQARDQLIAANNAAGSDVTSAAKNTASSAAKSTAADTVSGGAQNLSSFASDPNLNPIQQKLAVLVDAGKPLNQNQMDFLYKAIDKAAIKSSMLGDMPDGTANAGMRQLMSLQNLANAAKVESFDYTQLRPLSEGQVYLVFNRVLTEAGFIDKAKELGSKAAGAVGASASWLGKQATEKITTAKLNAAWKLEGSPTDSEQLKTFLTNYGGISPEVINKVYTDMKLPTDAAAGAAVSIEEIEKTIMQLNTKQQKQMMAYLKTQLGTA